MLIAQISDCHVTAGGAVVADRVDPVVGLRAAVRYVDALGPDLVVATGDLVADGTRAEYDRLCDELADLTPPILVVPGNHDSRRELRNRFASVAAGGDDEPVVWSVVRPSDAGDVRLIGLDTTVPGEHGGRLGPDLLSWLDAELAADETPTIVVQHHPPFRSHIPAMDRYALDDRAAEVEVLARHDHVIAVLAGHFHRASQRTIGGASAWACPSTAVQLAPSFADGPTTYSSDPAGLLVHRVDEGALTTHVVQLDTGAWWVPAWARHEASAADDPGRPAGDGS